MNNSVKPKTFLATTALDQFWDKSQAILFLNEWCKPYKNKEIWKNLDTEVLSDQKISEAHSEAAYQYTVQLYDFHFPILAKYLNEHPGKKFSLKYWQTVIGPFLFWYIQVLYNR